MLTAVIPALGACGGGVRAAGVMRPDPRDPRNPRDPRMSSKSRKLFLNVLGDSGDAPVQCFWDCFGIVLE